MLKPIAPFVISRMYRAKQDTMWRLFTEPEHMRKWWGPKGSRTEYIKIDLRPGGIAHYCLSAEGQSKMWGRLLYREIDKTEKLVFVTSFSDERGGITPHPLLPNWPLELLTTVVLIERNGRTDVNIEWLPINATEKEQQMFEASHNLMKQGWSGSLDRLQECVNSP